MTGSGRIGSTDGPKTERTKKMAKTARELHIATVITNACNGFTTKRKMKKMTNTQKNAKAEYNNDGDYKSLSANYRSSCSAIPL